MYIRINISTTSTCVFSCFHATRKTTFIACALCTTQKQTSSPVGHRLRRCPAMSTRTPSPELGHRQAPPASLPRARQGTSPSLRLPCPSPWEAEHPATSCTSHERGKCVCTRVQVSITNSVCSRRMQLIADHCILDDCLFSKANNVREAMDCFLTETAGSRQRWWMTTTSCKKNDGLLHHTHTPPFSYNNKKVRQCYLGLLSSPQCRLQHPQKPTL